jgi:hypothetical protein
MIDKLSFFEFIYDRHLIYHKKEVLKEPKPWTTDPIFQKFKSCNVYRELDRGSKYIIKKIINTDLNDTIKFLNIVAYRFFNLDQTFDGRVFNYILIPHNFNVESLVKELDEKSKVKPSIWNDAYLILPAIWNKELSNRKHVQVLYMLDWLAERVHLFLEDFKSKQTPEEQILKLREIPLVGPFIAGQIMLDLGYAKISKFGNNDWVTCGPGAYAGLEIIFKDIVNKNNAEDLIKYLASIQSEIFEHLEEQENKNWLEINYKNSYFNSDYLSFMDIQSCLCEFRKHYNLSNGKGKNRYFYG